MVYHMAKMKYKKGCKVEVFSPTESAIETWRSSEIIEGNGHNYTVKYIEGGLGDCPAVERVPLGAIRPTPPPVNCAFDWVCGDVVEVHHDNSWTVADVMDKLKRNCLLVRIRGSTSELKFHMNQVRPRQNWIHNRWIMLGKMPFGQPTTNPKRKSGKRKAPRFTSEVPEPPKKIQKLKILGPISMKVDQPREENEGNVACTSSVGSCSHNYRAPVEDNEEGSPSDAESICENRMNKATSFIPLKEALSTKIHRLELKAYHSTIEALYASGPLSWEKETMMSNLRLWLNISNDEHLTKIRTLTSHSHR